MKPVEVLAVLAAIGGIYTAWATYQKNQGAAAAGKIEFSLDGTVPRGIYPAAPGEVFGWGGLGLPSTDELYNMALGQTASAAGGAQVTVKKWQTPAVGEFAPNANGKPERVVHDGRQWDGHFRAAELQYGIPAGTLSRLAWQESRYNAGAVSPVGARGMMQIMPRTAESYGWALADLLKPERAIYYSAKVLADMFRYVNAPRDWAKALVAYNQGPSRVNRAVAERGADWILSGHIGPDGRKYYAVAVDVGIVPVRIGAGASVEATA